MTPAPSASASNGLVAVDEGQPVTAHAGPHGPHCDVAVRSWHDARARQREAVDARELEQSARCHELGERCAVLDRRKINVGGQGRA
jgi:hypothetical protein